MSDIRDFVSVAETLAIWKFFPVGKDRGTFAAKLMQWCQGDIAQAQWLAGKVDEFDEYPGPATLRKLITDRFRPSGPLASTPPLLPSVPDCRACGDLGTRWDEAAGKNVWCTCEQAERIQADTPDWLAVVNKMRGSPRREEERAKAVAEALKQLEEGYGGG